MTSAKKNLHRIQTSTQIRKHICVYRGVSLCVFVCTLPRAFDKFINLHCNKLLIFQMIILQIKHY